MKLIDEFGFLKIKQVIDFGTYRIQTMPRYEEQVTLINKYSHKDGFYYPPIVKSYKLNPNTNKMRRNAISNTARPALIHRVAVTHQVLCTTDMTSELFRKGDGYFMRSFLGFLYNTRLQFHNWWWEGRINTEQKPIIQFRDDQLPTILSEGLAAWQSFDSLQQKSYLNALFLFQRGKTMEWYYEKFIHYYISLDAIWKLVKPRINIKKNYFTHKERILNICDALNICHNENAIDVIYNTRHKLFHEGLFGVFDGLDPLTQTSSESFQTTLHLEQLIERMLIGVLNFRPAFLSTPWWYIRGWQNWD